MVDLLKMAIEIVDYYPWKMVIFLSYVNLHIWLVVSNVNWNFPYDAWDVILSIDWRLYFSRWLKPPTRIYSNHIHLYSFTVSRNLRNIHWSDLHCFLQGIPIVGQVTKWNICPWVDGWFLLAFRSDRNKEEIMGRYSTLWWTNKKLWKDPPFLMGKSIISMFTRG